MPVIASLATRGLAEVEEWNRPKRRLTGDTGSPSALRMIMGSFAYDKAQGKPG
jgi:hypothetical protein